MNNKNTFIFLLKIGIVITATSFLCMLLYKHDNKYQTLGPFGDKGYVDLSNVPFENSNPIYLISGWEYYNGILVSPKDFLTTSPPKPDQHIFIGQYGGFDMGNKNSSHHGSASYRLILKLPENISSYTLELPEIFSAYKLYINGKLVKTMGDPNPSTYISETRNDTISFEANGNTEIIFAVTDFSHIYSGIVYPPAFGTQQSIFKLIFNRFLFRSAICVCALTIGLLSILIGFLSKRRYSAIVYGFLCIFFIGYVSYPITISILGGSQILYAFELFSFCSMLTTCMFIVRKLSVQTKKWTLAFPIFGILMCILALIIAFNSSLGGLMLIRIYSKLITIFQWTTAIYILSISMYSIFKDYKFIHPIIYGAASFTVSLIMDRLFPNYEPIITGWFIELFSFVFILSIGISIAKEISTWYRDKTVLNERCNSMETLLSLQKTHYLAQQKQITQIKTIRHDMRHHFLIIDKLVYNKNYIKLREYISDFSSSINSTENIEYSKHSIVNILAYHYEFVCRENNINFDFRCSIKSQIGIADSDICGVISNLLENAVEACKQTPVEHRYIRVAMIQLGSMVSIEVENNTSNNIKKKSNEFISTKNGNETGYGISSIKFISQRYDGSTSFIWNNEKNIFTTNIILIQHFNS